MHVQLSSCLLNINNLFTFTLQVEELLGQIRANLEQSLADENTNEERNQSEFETDMSNTRADIQRCLQEIAEKTE